MDYVYDIITFLKNNTYNLKYNLKYNYILLFYLKK